MGPEELQAHRHALPAAARNIIASNRNTVTAPKNAVARQLRSSVLDLKMPKQMNQSTARIQNPLLPSHSIIANPPTYADFLSEPAF